MPSNTITIPEGVSQSKTLPADRRKSVLVFSPDADLAKFLLLNLEDRFHIVREHTLEEFERAMLEVPPDLVLVDLYAFSADIIKQLDIVRKIASSIPIIVLRAYLTLSSEMNNSIDELADIVFYKPVDVELITQAIEDLLK
jgi:DNA-binding NtrC family response regulator